MDDCSASGSTPICVEETSVLLFNGSTWVSDQVAGEKKVEQTHCSSGTMPICNSVSVMNPGIDVSVFNCGSETFTDLFDDPQLLKSDPTKALTLAKDAAFSLCDDDILKDMRYDAEVKDMGTKEQATLHPKPMLKVG